MPFNMNCTNKGCHKQMIPYIDPKTNKVYCSECEQEMENVSHFVKTQMKTLKQYKEKNTVSFSVKCNKCGKEARPKLIKNNTDVACPYCNGPLDHLSVAFRNMLKEKLKTADKDVV